MNKYPARDRLLTTFTTLALASGAAACQPEASPQPVPPTTEPSVESAAFPSCAVEVVAVDGLTVTLRLDTENAHTTFYAPSGAEYLPGDGTPLINGEVGGQTHTYQDAGTFSVEGSMSMEVAPGAEAHAPLRDGAVISCEPTEVVVSP